MSELILHHYPPSPVSEKIRTAMGLKNLGWRSVEQNRLPERPELLAMTGGYRRIPVLQVGADIYCDTACIFRELERRHPEPTLFPHDGHGLPFGLARWTDGPLFELAVRVAFAPAVDSLPPALVADRTRLYLGPDGDMAKEAEDLPHTLAQLRAQLGWLDQRLERSGRAFLLGEQAGLPDLLAWTVVWFVRGRYARAEEYFEEFPALLAWADRMQNIGHGNASEMTPQQALAVANDAEPQTPEQADPRDPQRLAPGQHVAITPLSVGGEQAVTGTVRALSRDVVVIHREHELCGTVAVHFPRVGYRVSVVESR